MPEFLNLIETLLEAVESDDLSFKKMQHKYDWWHEYFNLDLRNKNEESFYSDLKTIQSFLIEAKRNGETKAAFYVE